MACVSTKVAQIFYASLHKAIVLKRLSGNDWWNEFMQWPCWSSLCSSSIWNGTTLTKISSSPRYWMYVIKWPQKCPTLHHALGYVNSTSALTKFTSLRPPLSSFSLLFWWQPHSQHCYHCHAFKTSPKQLQQPVKVFIHHRFLFIVWKTVKLLWLT